MTATDREDEISRKFAVLELRPVILVASTCPYALGDLRRRTHEDGRFRTARQRAQKGVTHQVMAFPHIPFDAAMQHTHAIGQAGTAPAWDPER